MKLRLLLILLIVSSFATHSQNKVTRSCPIETGTAMNATKNPTTLAPNFTTVDINGNSHTLYSYLNAGKTVILELSATWCAPCWNFHQNGSLKTFYNTYGPSGTNEAMVLFVEADANTDTSELYGNSGTSQGDWVTGTPFPIINDDNIGALFNLSYFPTILMICPTGDYWEVGQGSTSYYTASQYYSFLLTCPTLSAPPIPGFSYPLSALINTSVGFTDESTGLPTSWNWTFQNGTPASSNLQHPVVSWSQPGTYNVTLVVSNSNGTSNALTQTITLFNPANTNNYEVTFEECVNSWTENFTPYGWITIDADGGNVWGDYSTLGITGPMGFNVYDHAEALLAIGGSGTMVPHSGNKSAMLVNTITSSAPNDDWLISPAIALGDSSSISVWAASLSTQWGAEEFYIAVSTTGTNPSDFTYVSPKLEPPATYTQYTADLSAYNYQTVHIGIHCVSNDHWILFIDDIFISTNTTPALPSEWEYTFSGNNHSILIQNTVPCTIDGIQLTNGDYIGVFYEDNGLLYCAGYEPYNSSGNIALTAWGDDTQTSAKDGLAVGEEFQFKIFRGSDQQVFDAQAEYYQPPVMPNTNTYAINGISGLSSLSAVSTQYQTISIPIGWRYISTYIEPLEPNIADVLSDVESSITIVKNATGQTYWPIYNINTIGEIQIGKGYQLYSTAASELVVEGYAVQPENTPINLPAGWSYLGYLRQSSAPVSTMLAPIVYSVSIMKNSLGQTFWPLFNINTIGSMHPGEGYQLNMITNETYTYPPNSASFQLNQPSLKQPNYYPSIAPTGNSMTLAVPSTQWSDGAEIAAFRPNGELVGSAVVLHPYTSLTLWGFDLILQKGLIEGEVFNLRLWNGHTEENLEIISWDKGNDVYQHNKLAVIGELTPSSKTPSLFQNKPNPFRTTTQFEFYLPQAGEARLSIFNLMGKEIAVITNGRFNEGMHQFEFNSASLPSGSYFYRLKYDSQTLNRKMIILP